MPGLFSVFWTTWARGKSGVCTNDKVLNIKLVSYLTSALHEWLVLNLVYSWSQEAGMGSYKIWNCILKIIKGFHLSSWSWQAWEIRSHGGFILEPEDMTLWLSFRLLESRDYSSHTNDLVEMLEGKLMVLLLTLNWERATWNISNCPKERNNYRLTRLEIHLHRTFPQVNEIQLIKHQEAKQAITHSSLRILEIATSDSHYALLSYMPEGWPSDRV